jgi:NTP pyrophosphatase (non-canonical NTP hydrolase)
MTKLDAQQLSELHQKMVEFNSKRGWNPSAQNLAKSVVIEAAELLEKFQWDNSEDDLKKKNLTDIGYEMADVLWYVFTLADNLNINIVKSFSEKLDHNDKKYPAEKFINGHNEEFYYAQKNKYRQDKKK